MSLTGRERIRGSLHGAALDTRPPQSACDCPSTGWHDQQTSNWKRRDQPEPRYAVRADSTPVSEEAFTKMQRDLMNHILVLEVLMGLLLFSIVVTGGFLGIQAWRKEPRRRAFKPLTHTRNSSDNFQPRPFHAHSHSTQSLVPYPSSTAYATQPGTVSFGATGYPTSSGKNLPKTPPSGGSLSADQHIYRTEPKTGSAASVVSTSSSSTARVMTNPFASPSGDSHAPLPPPPTPMHTSTPPSYPTSRFGAPDSPTHDPSPLKRAPGPASLLDDELTPAPRGGPSSSSRTGYANPNSEPLPGKKSARQMSVPRSVWDGSSGAGGDGATISGTNSSGAYPTVANYLARLQGTSKRELSRYTSGFVSQGWTVLDAMRGVTAAELKDAVRGMSSTDAEFLARSIEQELNWIDADRVRGGMGFRMVLGS